MTKIFEFLFHVDRIDLSQGGQLDFSFLSAWPAWAVFIALIVTVGYVWSIYRRESPDAPPVMRGLLMFLRVAVILLVLGMIFEPALVLRQNDVIHSSVVVMVDRSASMTINDALKSGAEQAKLEEVIKRAGLKPRTESQPTRYELARAALGADEAAGLQRLAGEQRIYLYTYDETPTLAQRIDRPEQVLPAVRELAAREPDGKRTLPVRSLEMVLEQLAGQTITGVVLLTDGRATVAGDSKRLEEMARSRDIPLFTVGLGDTRAPADCEIRRVTAERRAFVSEELPVKVDLANAGFAGRTARLELDVEGHPEMKIVQDVPLGEPGVNQTVVLRLKPQKAGAYQFRVKLEPMPGEFDADNNVSLPQEVEVLDQKLLTLLIDDLPRWEYQYLKNALFRDPTVQVSVLLKSADEKAPPEGSLPIKRFPGTKEELFKYHVLILGDLDSRTFSTEQLTWIDEFVRVKGGGLILIAGERGYNPDSFVGTPLETLLPIEVSSEQLAGNIKDEFRPELTIEGSVSPVLRFEKDLEGNRQIWSNLKGFYWFYRAKTAKPGAQVLLVNPDQENSFSADKKFPLMVLQRVGAGQVFFSAVDSTWRWRYYTGNRYFNTFWLQLVRHLALPQEQAVVEAESLRYTLGETAKLQFRLADPGSVSADVKRVKATVKLDAPGPEAREQSVTLERTNPRLAIFEGEFTPERSGKYNVTAEVAAKGGALAAKSDFLVAPSREEFLVPTRDQEFLAKLSASSGGRPLEPWQVATLPELLRNKSRTVPNDLTNEIWDSPLAMILFIGLITTEWIMRKRYRML